jgi:CDP-4-dehydro-6-deoxyglucose reductase, E1
MITLADDTINRDDLQALGSWVQCYRSDWIDNKLIHSNQKLTKGELTKELELKWNKMLGINHSLFVNSGSSAILLSLYSLLLSGKLKNKKIILPGLSWITDISSAMQLGFESILCDCNLHDLSVDLKHLEFLFANENPSVLILISVLGIVPDMDKIMGLCKKYKVVLIEDMCEAMYSSYAGKYLGTFGIMSMFSTYFGHVISTIEGGFASTNDEELFNIMISCRSHGWDRDLNEKEKRRLKSKYDTDDFNRMYTFYYPGFNLRSTELNAFLGLRQLDRLTEYVNIRFRNFKRYKEKLKNVNELDIILRDNDVISSLGFPVVSYNRKEIIKKLKNNQVEIRPLIAGNIVRQPFWKDKSIHLKNCDIIHDFGFYLPNHQNLTFDEIDFICDLIIK